MSQEFNTVKVGTTARGTFDLRHHQVTTSDFGYLIPICVRDLVPNDDFVVRPSVFCRMAPSAFPFYGSVTARIHSFFVPYRILYPHWSEWITQSAGNQTIPPYFTVKSISDLLALDPQFAGQTVTGQPRGLYGRVLANLGLNPNLLVGNALPETKRLSAFRSLAYYRIWLDWFMDSSISDHSQMVASFNESIKNGGFLNSTITARVLRYRCACFGKDYFTTAKLHPQSSNTPSKVGVSTDALLNPGLANNSSSSQLYISAADGKVYRNATGFSAVATDVVGSFTVEELRAATSLQRYLERNNYVGSKVINQLLAHFGISPTPERLDMSEFLGGSNLPLQVADVTSHSPNFSMVENPQTIGLGAQAGKGIIRGGTEEIRYHAKEHGVFMTLLSIVPDSAYYQGIPKQFELGVHGDPLDYYTPEFENLGYQEILNSEVFVPEGDISTSYQSYDPDGIFGYAPRYAFLKWQNDILAGDFVGNLSDQYGAMGADMDAWHLFRKFSYDDQDPLQLNNSFVECDNHYNDFDRVFQVTDNSLDHFYFSIDVDVKATRPMVPFAEPSLDSVSSADGNSIELPYGGTRL